MRNSIDLRRRKKGKPAHLSARGKINREAYIYTRLSRVLLFVFMSAGKAPCMHGAHTGTYGKLTPFFELSLPPPYGY